MKRKTLSMKMQWMILVQEMAEEDCLNLARAFKAKFKITNKIKQPRITIITCLLDELLLINLSFHKIDNKYTIF